MRDPKLTAYLEGRLSAAEAEAFLAALPEAERRHALALRRVCEAASALPHPAPSEDFAARAMARVRARKPPRRTIWTWLRSPSLSPLATLGAAAAAALLVLAAGAVLRRAPPPPAANEVVARLVYRAPLARSVAVAGDFNGWKPEAAPMRRGANGAWTAEIPLTAGRRYQYMFVVDGQWVTDPAAPATADDGFGNQNAILDL